MTDKETSVLTMRNVAARTTAFILTSRSIGTRKRERERERERETNRCRESYRN